MDTNIESGNTHSNNGNTNVPAAGNNIEEAAKVNTSDFLSLLHVAESQQEHASKQSELSGEFSWLLAACLRGLHVQLNGVAKDHCDHAAMTDSLIETVSRVEKRTERLEMKGGELNQMKATVDSHSSYLHALNEKIDGVSRRLEDVSVEFVDEHVQTPLLVEMAAIADRIRSEANSVDDTLGDIADSIDRRLFDNDFSWIGPKVEDAFDPKVHQPLKSEQTSYREKHGRIANVYCRGLKRNGRVVKCARVSIFKYNGSL